MNNDYYPYINLPLPYKYCSLEPYIDEKTMILHHGSHLQTYINNLNKLLENNPLLQRMSLEQLITSTTITPAALHENIKFNAGGVYNHRFFFDSIEPPSVARPIGKLSIAIAKVFNGYENFKKRFVEEALAVKGSGYVWLVIDNNTLNIIQTSNQNTPIENDMCPILTIDVWEHAYYLKHNSRRADYIQDWFKVVNWYQAEENYLKCLSIEQFPFAKLYIN